MLGLKSVREVQATAFADDTTLVAHGETEKELQSNVKSAIRTVTEWAQIAEIKLNAEKTQLISLGRNRTKQLEINGKIIDAKLSLHDTKGLQEEEMRARRDEEREQWRAERET